MTRRRYDFMDEGKPRLVNVLFWAAVILLLLAVLVFAGACR